MTTIYLIRHAEAEGNLYRIAQGQDNSNLTDRGWRQVLALEKRFADVHIDAVYSSDLYRTCATASAIYKSRGLPLHRRKDLREIHVGVWEQRTWGDIYRRWPEQMENFSRRMTLWHAEGAETPREVLKRVRAAIKEIAAENDGKTVAVFSHGYAIRVLLANLQGYTLEETGEKTPTGDNTAVACIEAEGKTMRVIFRDDNSHLEMPEFLEEGKQFKRFTALEPGLWFEPLQSKTQTDFFVQSMSSAWIEAGESQQFNAHRLLADAAQRTTLIGYREDEPVGVVQMGPENGWISILWTAPDWRKRGFGTQMIGQAVYHARPQGSKVLYAAVRPGSAAAAFFADNGFAFVASEEDGRQILRKNIAFDETFLTE